MNNTLLIILLVILLFGAGGWGFSRGWGYGPSGLTGILLIILLFFLLSGRL